MNVEDGWRDRAQMVVASPLNLISAITKNYNYI